ncbi:MAG: class I SAM-dependent methyltransferase [Candidatus Bathyarchaeia archaeon]|jgi:ubiquinone/menaquinone biosynthesis C-methylase UbiE
MSKNTQKLELDHTKDGVRKYWNHRSVAYDRWPGSRGDEEKALWKEYLLRAIGPEPKKVLDVGTGTGVIAMLLYELGHSVTGVDFSLEMMNAAKKKATARGANIKFFEGDVENLEFEDGTFDCVTARWVLWTMAHPEKAVQEWSRVVKHGGKVVIIDGEWINKGLLQKISAGSYRLYGFVKFGNNLPAGYEKDIREGIPNPHGVKKEQIMGYLSGAGVIDLSVTDLKPIRDLQRKRVPWYMKPSADHPSYLVSGIIPEKKEL